MGDQRFIRVVNWGKFQHYKDRNPPWVKLHRELLTSQTWVSLDDAGRVLAIACMLLAAATDNKIPADPSYIRRVAYLNQLPDLSVLLATGFVEFIDGSAASTVLANGTALHTNARPEAETEEETENRRTSARSFVPPTIEEVRNYCHERNNG